MEDLIKLKTAMDLIVTGLYEKERQKKKGEYFYSKRLIHGINLFQSLNYKYRKIVLSAQGAAGLCRKKRSGCGARAVPAVKQFIFRGN